MDIDRFTIVECKKILSSNTEIVVSSTQKEHIQAIIIHSLEQDIFKSEVTYKEGNVCISAFVDALVFLAQYFDFSLDEDKLLDMTLIPDLCSGESGEQRKYEYLKKHIPMCKLTSRIIQDLEIIDLDSFLLRDHFAFLDETKCDGATTKAPELCVSQETDQWSRSAALDYLYKLFGGDYICRHILPRASGEFLLEIVIKCKDISADFLIPALENAFKLEPTYELLTELISLGSRMGVESYVEEVKKLLHIPERTCDLHSPTNAIGTISNPALLPSLGQLIDVISDPKFVDNSFFGLRESLANALINCGKTAPNETIALIEEHCTDKDNNIRFCNHAIEGIKHNQSKDMDRPKNFRRFCAFCKRQRGHSEIE